MGRRLRSPRCRHRHRSIDRAGGLRADPLNEATPACAPPCSGPPTGPAQSIPNSPPATSRSYATPAATTTRRPAPSPPCCSLGSSPASVMTPTTSSETSTAPASLPRGPSHRRRRLPDPRRDPRRPPLDLQDTQRRAPGRAGQERSRQALRDTARPNTSMNTPEPLDNA
jgi:hypothetical protein